MEKEDIKQIEPLKICNHCGGNISKQDEKFMLHYEKDIALHYACWQIIVHHNDPPDVEY